MKTALITGIGGQDGSYLAEFLLNKGYEVHGLVRRNSNYDVIPNIAHIKDRIILHYSDLTDSVNLRNIVISVKPDEVYNLAAQSHVHISFEVPEYTTDANALGVLRLLESVRLLNEIKNVKFYQASTSEMFGHVKTVPQNENTPFYPRSPYGVAKLYGHWISINYRESYNLFACNGILFNHESPRRGETFVTRKITKGFQNIINGKQSTIELGNIDSMRDWGHAKDFVRGMWMMLNHDKPDDYVLATGIQHSVRDFCNMTALWHGIDIEWIGKGIEEKGIDTRTGKTYFEINPKYYRPADVNTLLGDSTKARTILGWKPMLTLADLVDDMCKNELKI
jgi:GDPmannose 4,6-dehydratase